MINHYQNLTFSIISSFALRVGETGVRGGGEREVGEGMYYYMWPCQRNNINPKFLRNPFFRDGRLSVNRMIAIFATIFRWCESAQLESKRTVHTP